MPPVLIKNGIIGNAVKSFVGDVLFEGEKIIETGESIVCSDAEVFDACGCYVVPGGVDPHTHVMLEAGGCRVSDGFTKASYAAVWGGTTTIVEHPGFMPAGSRLAAALDKTLAAGEGNSYTDFGVHAVFQGYGEQVAEELPSVVRSGFPTGKVYTTYDWKMADREIFSLMKEMAKYSGLLLFHAENDAIVNGLAGKFRHDGKTGCSSWPASRPDYCEAEAIYRILSLARSTGTVPYIVHVSSSLGLKKIIEARRSGQKVYAETCPQYLCLTDRCYGYENGLDYVMAPPLRKQSDCSLLWKAIGSGEIDTVGTDHCSFSRADKIKLGCDSVFKAPSGIPGIETRLPVLFSEGVIKGRISLEQFVGITSTNPSRILGLEYKGRIEAGADADIVIIDPGTEYVLSKDSLHQAADYTPYDGMRIRGLPTHIWLRGKAVIINRIFAAEKPFGRFVKRYPPHKKF